MYSTVEWKCGRPNTSMITAAGHYCFVEGSIMGGQEINVLNHMGKTIPYFCEYWFVAYSLPNDSMKMRKSEFFLRWSDKTCCPVDNAAGFNANHCHRTGAVPSIAGCFEVNRSKAGSGCDFRLHSSRLPSPGKETMITSWVKTTNIDE